MKIGASVSKEQLDSATLAVQKELTRAGFWDENSSLLEADVYWRLIFRITMPAALGFFVHKTDALHSLLGYEAGNIYIPQWVLSHGPWHQRGSLRDVVRHQYGHAIAHYYSSLIQRSPRFSATFGGRYFGKRLTRASHDEFVSRYAEVCPGAPKGANVVAFEQVAA